MRARDMVVFLAATIAYTWCLFLYFQFDDFWLLRYAPRQLGDLATFFSHPSKLLTGREEPLYLGVRHLFQPVLWLTHVLETWISGVPLQAMVFHATSLLTHGLACVVLHRLLCRLLPPRSAWFAAIFFALHPAGAQAVSWTVARGDILVALFAMLAFLWLLNSPREKLHWHSLLAGALMLLGLGSKPTATILMLPLLLVLWTVGKGLPKRRLLLCTVLLILPLAFGMLFRARYLGSWSVSYVNGVSCRLEQAPQVLAALPRVFSYLLLSFNPCGERTDLAAGLAFLPVWAMAGVWLLLCVAAIHLSPARTGLRLTGGALVLGLVILPALYHWHFYSGAPGVYLSRSLYLVLPAWAFLFGSLLAPLEECARQTKMHSIVIGVAAGLCLLVSVDGLWHVAKLELGAARITRKKMAALEAQIAREPAGTTIVIEDPERLFHGVVMTLAQIEAAMRRPFRAEDARVVHVDRRESLLTVPARPSLAGRLKVFTWNREQESLVALSEVLPEVTRPLPGLVRQEGMEFHPLAAVTPRSFRAIRIESKDPLSGVWWCRIQTERISLVKSVSMEKGRGIVYVGDELEFFLSRQLLSIVLVDVAAGSQDVTVTLLSSLPGISILAPVHVDVPANETPTFVFENCPTGHRIRLTCMMFVAGNDHALVYEAPYSAALARANGSLAYTPQAQHLVHGPPFFSREVPWEQAMPRVFAGFLVPYGIESFPVTWWIETRDPKTGQISARSGKLEFAVLRKKD